MSAAARSTALLGIGVHPRRSAVNPTEPMSKRVTLKQLAANRANAQKSTGPHTANGKAVSKLNALKHGILSEQVLVRGVNFKESRHELAKLHQRFWDELKPVGPVEEMLVDQIVTARWRLRRALTAESGEIALSVDGGQWQRQTRNLKLTTVMWEMEEEPALGMSNSAFGNSFMANQLRRVRAVVEAGDELTEAAVGEVRFRGKPYQLTKRLEELRLKSHPHPEGLPPEALRQQRKAEILAWLDREIRMLSWSESRCEERERSEEEAHQAAAVLPPLEVLEKIQRYETKLDRQILRAMAQLERLQRMRQGETLPAPVAVVTDRL
jgi:hypothetical protein